MRRRHGSSEVRLCAHPAGPATRDSGTEPIRSASCSRVMPCNLGCVSTPRTSGVSAQMTVQASASRRRRGSRMGSLIGTARTYSTASNLRCSTCRSAFLNRAFRCIPSELWGVENNLNIANMDWDEFVAVTDQHRVFRGF